MNDIATAARVAEYRRADGALGRDETEVPPTVEQQDADHEPGDDIHPQGEPARPPAADRVADGRRRTEDGQGVVDPTEGQRGDHVAELRRRPRRSLRAAFLIIAGMVFASVTIEPALEGIREAIAWNYATILPLGWFALPLGAMAAWLAIIIVALVLRACGLAQPRWAFQRHLEILQRNGPPLGMLGTLAGMASALPGIDGTVESVLRVLPGMGTAVYTTIWGTTIGIVASNLSRFRAARDPAPHPSAHASRAAGGFVLVAAVLLAGAGAEAATRETQGRPTDPELNSLRILIHRSAERVGVHPALAESLAICESGLDPIAISPKGAVGLFQITRGTARDLGVRNRFHPRQNAEGGLRYLRDLLLEFRSPSIAIVAYNAGPGFVRSWLRTPRTTLVPKESQALARCVIGRFRRLQAQAHPLEGGH